MMINIPKSSFQTVLLQFCWVQCVFNAYDSCIILANTVGINFRSSLLCTLHKEHLYGRYVEHSKSVIMWFHSCFYIEYEGRWLAHGKESLPPLFVDIKSVFRTTQHFLLQPFLSKYRCCLLYFLWKGKIEWVHLICGPQRSRTESKREGKLMSEESPLRVGYKKVLAWVLPPIPQPYPGQSANKSACQHGWSRTAYWGETNTGR